MKNRGGDNANNVTATVYWSEVGTLVTPDMWALLGCPSKKPHPMGIRDSEPMKSMKH